MRGDAAPTPDVLPAFGATGPARRLPGGAGTTWVAGDVVLKPEPSPRRAAWGARIYGSLRGPGFRVPRPVPAAGGEWSVDGWAAWERVDGEPAPVAHWVELVAAGRAFHAALAAEPRPAWIERRTDRWSAGDRVAWEEAHVDVAPEPAGLVERLSAARRPVTLTSQLIHGDIVGNVLFADGEVPAIIDFSPYWRPAGFALAVAAVDALTWSNAGAEILDVLEDEPELDQLLLRALIYRTVSEALGRPDPESREAVRRAKEPVVDLVLARVSGRPRPAAYLDDRGLSDLVSRALGRGVRRVERVQGHTHALRARVELEDGAQAFAKVGAAQPELDVYRALDGAPFLPRPLAVSPGLLVLDALAAGGWVRTWTPELVSRTRALLEEVHALPAPPTLPRVDIGTPWDTIAADPSWLLHIQVCSPQWLDANLDALRAASAAAPTSGDRLVHLDVCAANVWHGDGRVVLADWGSAAAGHPWLDHHLWLVALHTEGGPAPEEQQGPHAASHAALIAGMQVLLTPSRDSDPSLFTQRRARLVSALAWASRQLGLAPPYGP